MNVHRWCLHLLASMLPVSTAGALAELTTSNVKAGWPWWLPWWFVDIGRGLSQRIEWGECYIGNSGWSMLELEPLATANRDRKIRVTLDTLFPLGQLLQSLVFFLIGKNMFNCMHAGPDSDQDEMVGLPKQDRSSDAWCLSWNILQNWKTRSNYPRWL